MDLTYDHIQEHAYDNDAQKNDSESSLNKDIQDAYKAFSASPWGAKIGGFFGNVAKQVRRWLAFNIQPVLTRDKGRVGVPPSF